MTNRRIKHRTRLEQFRETEKLRAWLKNLDDTSVYTRGLLKTAVDDLGYATTAKFTGLPPATISTWLNRIPIEPALNRAERRRNEQRIEWEQLVLDDRDRPNRSSPSKIPSPGLAENLPRSF